MDTVSIMIADENILVRKIIRMIIQGDPRVSVIKEAEDGLDLLDQLNYFIPDIIIMDSSLSTLSGLNADRTIKELYPEVKLIILINDINLINYYRANNIKVHSYVLINDIKNINYIIDNVIKGNYYISPYFK